MILTPVDYRPMEVVTYGQVGIKTLRLNAFVPVKAERPVPAMVEIHGGWFEGGGPSESVPGFVAQRGLGYFAIAYRLGGEGGLPECIRDCRNAIRFLRKNAARFNIDPDRIAVMGGSAGGHLSLMAGVVPERFDDGGPLPELQGVSAKVCGVFSYIPPTDFVRFWKQGPDDVVTAPDGTKTFRGPLPNVENDARPHLRALFHGATPDTKAGAALYDRMCPIGHVRKGLPPLLVCEGARDPILPGTMAKDFADRVKRTGSDVTYWLSDNGHEWPAGEGFDALLNGFLDRIYR
ncbi:alpha/beta hydrolase [bacterium]|nr:MAG: alpha/beta hydrolase [bacterium]